MKRSLFVLLVLVSITVGCNKKIQQQKQSTMDPSATFDNTRWKLDKLSGVNPLPTIEKDVFIQFNESDSSFKGYAGCNNLMGKYTRNVAKLTIGPAAMTRMMCGPEQMSVEDGFSRAINATDNYIITADNLELRKGTEVLATFKALYLK